MSIEELLQMMVERDATDLILTVGSSPVLRIGKKLIFTQLESLSPKKIEELIEPLIGKEKKDEFKSSLSELNFSYSLTGWGRFRVTLFKQRSSIAVAVRRITANIPSIKELNLPEMPLRLFSSLKDGLVLVTGPAGGGKSTTLGTMTQILNDEYSYHIVSIEDPIEYLFKHNKSIVEQRSVPDDVPSFSVALEEVLRQNPDVVIVGEIKNPQTMRSTLRIAESGILVLATFHTPTVSETINRILNFFPGEESAIQRQLSMILRGVFSQQLIPVAGKNGLIPAWEVLIVNEKVDKLIREGAIHQIDNVIGTSSKSGMQSMDQSLINLFERKLISKQDLLLRIKEKDREEVKGLLSDTEI